MKSFCRNHLFFLTALILVALSGTLYIANGENIPVIPHDQLDDQVICYKMASDHFGATYYPEFMGGQPSSALPLSVPAMFLLYLAFPPATAFAVNLFFVMVTAYVSLYACLRLLGTRDSMAALTSLAYSFLPFYSVYGLSSMGVPLVLLALQISAQKSKTALSVFLCILYASYSSLVWIGFAVCFGVILFSTYLAIRKEWKKFRQSTLLLVVLIASYCVFNIDMISSVLFSGVESHRAEFVIEAEEAGAGSVWRFFLEGYYHSVSNHYYLAVFDFVVLLIGGIWILQRKRASQADAVIRHLLKWVGLGLMIAFLIALFKIAYHSSCVVELRSGLPASLKSFQLDRFYWLYPSIWYITSGLAGEALLRIAKMRDRVILGWVPILIAFILTISTSAQSNVVVENAKCMITGTSTEQLTWQQFYAEDLFDEIRRDIEASDEDSRNRVISIGLHPAVALYNGLATLDGYSTNYPLAYKHKFARIIEGELSKSEALKQYYQGWGNRCYVFSHELGRNYMFPKDSSTQLNDLSIDVNALKDMGAGYVVCAVPIRNSNELGLEEIGHYRTDQSYYELWLYKVI